VVDLPWAALQSSNDCSDYERPAHSVTVSNFYIGKYEVTQAQWKAVMGNNPSNTIGDNLPVENVSWNNVQEFISRLNAQTGKNYRLPTEAEWEYAARGGNLSKGFKYSGSNSLDEVAWYFENSNDRTHPVGSKKPNELGIYDMSGNVFEWCSNLFRYYTGNTPDYLSSSRVFRGGGYISLATRARVSTRGMGLPDMRAKTNGFRLAISF